MTTKTLGIPDYRSLDQSGEGAKAALRMEARAREPISAQMLAALVWPLVTPEVRRVLELGCGSGALARRMAERFSDVAITAIDKSEAMLLAATHWAREEGVSTVAFRQADACSPAAFEGGPFDLILSSVTVPYLTDEETEELVARAVSALRPGGRLVFIEQDLLADSLNIPDYDLFRRVFARDDRQLKRTLALGLRPVLRQAGLSVEPRLSFLWTDEAYGQYVRALLQRAAEDARAKGRISAEEEQRWHALLEAQRLAGDFYYGLVYHRISGQKPG